MPNRVRRCNSCTSRCSFHWFNRFEDGCTTTNWFVCKYFRWLRFVDSKEIIIVSRRESTYRFPPSLITPVAISRSLITAARDDDARRWLPTFFIPIVVLILLNFFRFGPRFFPFIIVDCFHLSAILFIFVESSLFFFGLQLLLPLSSTSLVP